jgi:trans-AT polyketide synthase, acyltransferase and oxidoreductase domains
MLAVAQTEHERIRQPPVQASRPIVFQFSGQGSQYHQMGRELFETEPVFRAALQRLDALVQDVAGGSVLARLYDPARTTAEPFTETTITHPAIVMVELALAETLMASGITPDLLLGASLGEYTAAVLAGVLEPEECLPRLVAMARSAAECEPGGMLAVLGPEDLHEHEPELRRLELAARNYDGHFVLAGSLGALADAERILAERAVPFHRLPVAHGFHSRLMDPGRAGFDALWSGVELRSPRIPLISCVTTGRVSRLTIDHLWRVGRDPIEFSATLAALESTGPHLYVDVGPSGTLHNFVRANLARAPGSPSGSLPLLTPFASDARQLARVRKHVGSGATDTPATVRAADGVLMVYGFPGQGAQSTGMGADLFDRFPELVSEADATLGYSIRDLCLENREGLLKRTEFTQPALYVVETMSYLHRSREVTRPPDYLVGHSLGEYAALFAADVFDFATGLRLVQRRGELMAQAAPGGMAAVVGCDLETVQATLAEADLTSLDLANHNTPDQVVLAGPAADLQSASAHLERRGARTVMLPVSAPFHSRYMRAAAEAFRELLDATALRPPRIPVIANVDARPYRPERLRETLAAQIASSVRWVDTIRYLEAQGEFTFEELGPGRALTNMVRKIHHAPPAPPSAPSRDPTAAPRSPAPTGSVPTAELLGAPAFRERYGLRLAYLTGGMYGGISSRALIAGIAKVGGMGFLGTGGLPLAAVEAELRDVAGALDAGQRFGVNVLHQPGHPEREQALIDLLLRHRVSTIEASGFPRATPALVKYRLKGGRIIAKVSRTDTARSFFQPASDEIVRRLLERGEVTAHEAAQAATMPIADDLCVEAGGGWRADAPSLAPLLPAVVRLRDELAGPWDPVHVGAAGGIGTPEAAAAALVLGAQFLLTGSVNQCTVEAATSPEAKQMLSRLEVHDTEPAPCGEMFELGVRARILKRGVFLAARAERLYQLWRTHESFSDLDAATQREIEETYLRRPFEEAWRAQLADDPLVGSANGGPVDGKRRLALAFRSYLDAGFALARAGAAGRQVDYLVYCGPAMGAFNQWVRGTELEPWKARHVDVIAETLLTRTAQLLHGGWPSPVSPARP